MNLRRWRIFTTFLLFLLPCYGVEIKVTREGIQEGVMTPKHWFTYVRNFLFHLHKKIFVKVFHWEIRNFYSVQLRKMFAHAGLIQIVSSKMDDFLFVYFSSAIKEIKFWHK